MLVRTPAPVWTARSGDSSPGPADGRRGRCARGYAGCGTRWPAYFALRTDVIDGVALRPTGFKILLEILSRGRWRTVTEVPYRFERREAGSSKAELKQGLVYLRHVGRLVTGPGRRRGLTSVTGQQPLRAPARRAAASVAAYPSR